MSSKSLSYYKVGEKKIFYQQSGPDQFEVQVLFIHGSPGTSEAFKNYLLDSDLNTKYKLIAVDRIGFGRSEPGKIVTRMVDHAYYLKPVLEVIRQKKIFTILVGHSLGGPIAVQMALDYPDLVDAMVLVAPSVDPQTEDPRWYNVLMSLRPIQWMMPDEFIWSNRELMPLAQELKIQDQLWNKIKIKTTVIQGLKDTLVLPSTAEYVEKKLPKEILKVVRVQDQGHFVLWKRPDLVKSEILNLIQSFESKKDE